MSSILLFAVKSLGYDIDSSLYLQRENFRIWQIFTHSVMHIDLIHFLKNTATFIAILFFRKYTRQFNYEKLYAAVFLTVPILVTLDFFLLWDFAAVAGASGILFTLLGAHIFLYTKKDYLLTVLAIISLALIDIVFVKNLNFTFGYYVHYLGMFYGMFLSEMTQ